MRTFTDAVDILRLRNSYRKTFEGTSEGRRVLRDLAKVCHAASTTFDEDPREAARREGKRQIWLRIQMLMNMQDDEVLNHFKQGDNDV